MPRPYSFLLFDFVNTLYMPDASAVPTIEVDGKRVVSTAALLKERLAEHLGHLDVRTIYQAHRDAWAWVEAQRGDDHAEVEAPDRFRHILGLLGIADPAPRLVDAAVDLHMGAVTGTFRLPAEHRALLERLHGKFRMGILSNFDHGPPLRQLLVNDGIADWFESIVISAEIRCRKPSQRAFAAALAPCNVDNTAVLHVGDTWEADVEGASAASLDVAWINLHRAALPHPDRATYVVERLTDLEPLLNA